MLRVLKSGRDYSLGTYKDWGELQKKYFELMTLFCQFALRENGEEKHWYKKILELMPKDDSSV